jgi:hypothetical protein
MAWTTSALFLLDESRLLYGLACLIWLGLAWRGLAGARLAFARRAVSLLLALALPAQSFAVVAAEARGPAHVHSPALVGAAAGHHWHGEVGHHHHAAGEAMLVDDSSRAHDALASGEDKRAAFGAVDALAAASLPVPPLPGSHGPHAVGAAPAATHVASTPEKPPRLLSDSLPA